jgi:hypothetical protein
MEKCEERPKGKWNNVTLFNESAVNDAHLDFGGKECQQGHEVDDAAAGKGKRSLIDLAKKREEPTQRHGLPRRGKGGENSHAWQAP